LPHAKVNGSYKHSQTKKFEQVPITKFVFLAGRVNLKKKGTTMSLADCKSHMKNTADDPIRAAVTLGMEWRLSKNFFPGKLELWHNWLVLVTTFSYGLHSASVKLHFAGKSRLGETINCHIIL
jgi:hypothetical protein